MIGMARNTISESLTLVTNIMIKAPKKSTVLRKATEAPAPMVDFIWVVSAVSRDITSPERVCS